MDGADRSDRLFCQENHGAALPGKPMKSLNQDKNGKIFKITKNDPLYTRIVEGVICIPSTKMKNAIVLEKSMLYNNERLLFP